MIPRLSNPRNNDAPPGCDLPLGPLVRGRRSRRAVFRPFRGEARLRLLDMNLQQPRESALSQALAHCVQKLGGLENPSAEEIHLLCLSDRHALVRALLVARGGKMVSVTAECQGCGSVLELSLDIAALKLPRMPASGEVTLSRREAGRAVRCRLRLPCANDLDRATSEASLVGLCLGLSAEAAEPWLAVAEQILSRCDPLGHITVAGCCPDCGATVSTELDLIAKWLASLKNDSAALVGEIHVLASRYHWTEKDILELPDARRHLYLDLCWGSETEPFEWPA